MEEFLYKLAKTRNDLYNKMSIYTGKGIMKESKRDMMKFICINEIIEWLPKKEKEMFERIEKSL